MTFILPNKKESQAAMLSVSLWTQARHATLLNKMRTYATERQMAVGRVTDGKMISDGWMFTVKREHTQHRQSLYFQVRCLKLSSERFCLFRQEEKNNCPKLINNEHNGKLKPQFVVLVSCIAFSASNI